MSSFKLKERFPFSPDTMSSSFNELVQYGASHPLKLFAGASFLCFALFPVLAFLSFALVTLLVTLVAAILWEGFLVLCGVIGLAVALAAALTMAGCCTGAATLVYFMIVTLYSSGQKIKSKTRLRNVGSKTESAETAFDSYSVSESKED